MFALCAFPVEQETTGGEREVQKLAEKLLPCSIRISSMI